MLIRWLAVSAIAIAMSPLAHALAQDRPGRWNVSFTPRFWYMTVNSNSFSESTTVQKTFETTEIPLYGGSIRVAPPGFEATDFLLTGFYGTDRVNGKVLFATGANANTRTDVARTDIELLVRNKLADTSVAWFYGVRWVLLEEDSLLQSGFTFSASNSNSMVERTNFYFGEVGLSFSTPFDRAGKHILFANILAGMGFESQEVQNRASASDPDEDGLFPLLDINLGYEFHFLPRASAHFRYRTFVLREIIRDEIMVLHGPEIGFTVRF